MGKIQLHESEPEDDQDPEESAEADPQTVQ